MSDNSVENQLRSILNEAAQKLNLGKFSLDLNLGASQGDGFLSESYKSSIIDEENNEKIDLFIKIAPKDDVRREETSIVTAYQNEIYFYSSILPAFQKFQQKWKVSKPFNNFAKFLTGSTQCYNEIVVLEDITKSGYEMIDKQLILNDQQIKFILETYGRLHAVSFCMKNQVKNEYNKLIERLSDNVITRFTLTRRFCMGLSRMVSRSFEALDPQKDYDVREKFKKYVDNTKSIFTEVINYQGHHACILHGDCWSNNIMFKFQDSQLEDIKFIDFQLAWTGSPVYDLSYFLYSGGSKILFDKLEDYLDVYYKSFCENVKEMGCEPDKVLPRKVLTEEWKKYSKFGMLMAILLSYIKLLPKEEAIALSKSLENDLSKTEPKTRSYDTFSFNERVRNIIVHMYEIDAL